MRALELLEYIKYDNSTFLKRWNTQGRPYEDEIGSEGENFISWLETHDPTQKKKYVNWMIMRYLKNDIKHLEDIPTRIAPALDKFDRLSRKKLLKPEHKDINKIKNIEDVLDIYSEENTESNSEASKSTEQSFYESDEAELVMNNNEYKIVIPKTHAASCYFGKNTRWCTTSKDNPDTFEEYAEKGPLYIILHKKSNTRWQFHFESGQFMNEKDQAINLQEFADNHPIIAKEFKDSISPVFNKTAPKDVLIKACPNNIFYYDNVTFKDITIALKNVDKLQDSHDFFDEITGYDLSLDDKIELAKINTSIIYFYHTMSFEDYKKLFAAVPSAMGDLGDIADMNEFSDEDYAEIAIGAINTDFNAIKYVPSRELNNETFLHSVLATAKTPEHIKTILSLSNDNLSFPSKGLIGALLRGT